MSAASQVLPLELIPGLDLALTELEVTLSEQRAVHALLLRRVLAVGQILPREGCELGALRRWRLVLNVSETAAEHLLVQAELLTVLPGGLEALDSGLLGVEQAGAFTRAMHDLPIDVVRQVWEQLRDRLIRDATCGGVLPPARLKSLVAGWVIAADPDAAVDRRRQAQDQAAVDYRKRDDGLVDLFAIGLTGPNAQAVLTRIRARAAAWGDGDERPARPAPAGGVG